MNIELNAFFAAMRQIERNFAERKGDFALFACFEPEESLARWEVVVSAPWAPRHDRRTLQMFVSALDENLTPEDRLSIGRVVVVEPSDEDVQRLNALFGGSEYAWDLREVEYFGYRVDRAVILSSHDYWRFVKLLFPKDARFVFFYRNGDLNIRVSWKLRADPARPNKFSRTIVIKISREALDDYIYIDDPRREVSERQLIAYLDSRLRAFNPEHNKLAHETPPLEEWKVTTQVFERPAALG